MNGGTRQNRCGEPGLQHDTLGRWSSQVSRQTMSRTYLAAIFELSASSKTVLDCMLLVEAVVEGTVDGEEGAAD